MPHSNVTWIQNIPFVPATALALKTVGGRLQRGSNVALQDRDLQVWMDTVRRDGICVVKDFLPADVCEELRAGIDQLLVAHPSAIHTDDLRADERLYLGGVPPAPFGSVFSDTQLLSCAAAALGANPIALATLANRLRDVPGNLGSGGGWHRDSFTNQFKAIIYLNDVTDHTGPFQYILRSHRLRGMIRDQKTARLGISQSRICDDQIERITAGHPDRLFSATGKGGTLILADTTGLHRGKPIAHGVRYALTNYYYARGVAISGLKGHFKPILGEHIPYARTANTSIEST